MKKTLALLLAGAMALSMAACSSSESKPATTEKNDDAISVCVVYSGTLGDKSYNDSCNIGSTKAKEDFGIELKSLEGSTADEWKANLLSACEEGYDLVICASSNCEEYLKEYAPQYPNVKFAIIDTTVPGDNVISVSFAQNQGSFLPTKKAPMSSVHQQIPLQAVRTASVTCFLSTSQRAEISPDHRIAPSAPESDPPLRERITGRFPG